METFLGWVSLALTVLGAIWLYRLAKSRFGSGSAGGTSEEAIENARKAGLKIEWDELEIDQLDANRGFQRHVERVAQSDVPFQEVAQLAQSGSPGIAALGLSAIAKRDDVPEKWISNAIRSLASCPYFLEPFVYRVLLEQAKEPVIGRVLAKLGEDMDWDAMARFVQERRERGEVVDVGTFRGNVPPSQVETLELFI